jgi:hypothetical protein
MRIFACAFAMAVYFHLFETFNWMFLFLACAGIGIALVQDLFDLAHTLDQRRWHGHS